MSPAFAFSLYVVIWWLVLFAMLPIGVRSQAEEGNVAPGTAESAPHAPHLIPKVLATTAVASLIFAGVYAIIAYHLISIDDIPFLPRYETIK